MRRLGASRFASSARARQAQHSRGPVKDWTDDPIDLKVWERRRAIPSSTTISARCSSAGDNAVARNYLRLLIDKIVVTGPRVQIIGKAAETVAMMSPTPGELQSANPTEGVRTSVGHWLPNLSPSENRSAVAVVPLPTREKRRRSRRLGPPRVTELLAQAGGGVGSCHLTLNFGRAMGAEGYRE